MSERKDQYTYFAFISYQREDEEWAKWLAHELEHYPVTLNGRDDLPKELRPIFRDVDELSAGNLPQQIYQALESSKHLIVICSPHSAKSPWVNKEIETFISMGKTDKIFPFIIDGTAMCKDPDDPNECFPPALRNLPKNDERLGANVNENGHGANKLRTCDDCPIKEERANKNNQGDINEKGRDAAVVKIVAGMLGLSFDSLWQRYEREKAEEERKIREQRDKLMIAQSRFVAEKASSLVEKGDTYLARRILLNVLPTKKHPDWPYTSEVESALRKACRTDSAIFNITHDDTDYVHFSKDGKYVFTPHRSWSLESGKELNNAELEARHFTPTFYSCDTELITDKKNVTKAILSPDKKRILLVKDYFFEYDNYDDFEEEEKHRYEVVLYDVVNGKELNTLRHANRKIGLNSFSSDGRFIVTASKDNTICIWDADSGKKLKCMNGHTAFVNTAFFSPVGLRIVSSSEDCTVRIWDAKKGAEIKRLIGHSNNVLYASFSPDNHRIASVSLDNTIRLWDIKRKLEIKNTKPMPSVNISSDGHRIIFGNDLNSIKIWDLVTGTIVNRAESSKSQYKHHPLYVNMINFSPDNKRIIIAAEDKVVRIWDAESDRKLRRLIGHNWTVNTASYSTDGRFIITASDDGTIRIWNADNGQEIKCIEVHEHINSAFFSPDSNYIVSAQRKGPVRIWNTETGQELRTLEGHSGIVKMASFSPDSKLIVTASNDGTAKIWKTGTGEEIMELKGHNGYVLSAAFSPDGKQIVTASSDGTSIIWDVMSGREKMKIHNGSGFVSALFSYDGKQIVTLSSDGKIAISDYPVFEELVDKNYECFKDNPLTEEERKKYYLD